MAREVPRSSGGRADDAVEWDARQWLIDNDLWDDNVGMPPERYDQQPTSTKYRVRSDGCE